MHPVVVKAFTNDHSEAVCDFNKRIEACGESWRFPESPIPQWLPRRNLIPIYQEYFVALEGNKVRGAYILKPQEFALNGKVTMIADYRLPISEGLVNNQYSMIGFLMIKDALKQQPLLFALGMGDYNEPIVGLLKAMKWSMVSCPFFVKVMHPFRFFQEIDFLRRKQFYPIILDILAFSGLGWLALKSLQWAKGLSNLAMDKVICEEVSSFSFWADEIWRRSKEAYSMIATRDARILNTLYPESSDRFRRIKVMRSGEVIGWAVVLNTKMNKHKHFGGMVVGSVVDCLAIPGKERQVVKTATQFLQGQGVDIIVTNQLHRSWCKAFRRDGFLEGPSNFIFATSPQLARKLESFELNAPLVHMTRGDGDGPINL